MTDETPETGAERPSAHAVVAWLLADEAYRDEVFAGLEREILRRAETLGEVPAWVRLMLTPETAVEGGR